MSDQPDKPTAEQVEFAEKVMAAIDPIFDAQDPEYWVAVNLIATRDTARDLAVEAAAIERAALSCDSQTAGCDKTNVACHYIDASAIRALISPPHKAALAEYTDELAAKDRTITDLKAQLYSLQAGDEQRVRDISRLTIERDDARAQLAASREKEQKLIEHFEKRIETEVSKVAQLLRERQAERAAVLESAASEMTDELCEKAWSDSQMPQGEAFSDYLRYAIRAMIPASDRLALDRYVEKKVREGRLAELQKLPRDVIAYDYPNQVTVVLAKDIDARLAQLRAVPAAPPKEKTDAR